MDLRQCARQGHPGQVRGGPRRGLAEEPAAGHPAFPRGHRRLREPGRPGDHQPPRGSRRHRPGVQREGRLRARRLHRRHAGPGAQGARARADAAGLQRERHRPGERGREAGHRRQGRPHGPAERPGGAAQGGGGEDRPHLRARHPLPGRRVLALPLPQVQGRAPGGGARSAGGQLRRRPRQLHLPPLEPGLRPLPRLRGWQALPARGLPPLRPDAPEGRRPDAHLRSSGRHLPGPDPGPDALCQGGGHPLPAGLPGPPAPGPGGLCEDLS